MTGREHGQDSERLNAPAHALRLFRIVGDEGRSYTATTFPPDPWQGCERIVRTLRAIGALVPASGDNYAVLDVLDERGDIVQDFGVTRDGFRWLYRKLRLRVEREEVPGG